MIVFADFERKVVVERTLAGLKAARARGVRLGRKRKLLAAQIREARRLIRTGMKAEAVARRYHVSRSTLYLHLRQIRPHRRRNCASLSEAYALCRSRAGLDSAYDYDVEDTRVGRGHSFQAG